MDTIETIQSLLKCNGSARPVTVALMPNDTRLISAAPDLLAALEKSAVALHEAAILLTAKGLAGCGSIMAGHADIARAAILKAEGDGEAGGVK